jgi:hypothetical protein
VVDGPGLRRCQRLSTAKSTVSGIVRHLPSLTALETLGERCGMRAWSDLGVRLGFAARAVSYFVRLPSPRPSSGPVKRPCAGSPSWMIQPPAPRRQRDQIKAVRRRPSQTVRRPLPRTTWRAYGCRLTDRKRPPLLDRLRERPMQNCRRLQSCCGHPDVLTVRAPQHPGEAVRGQ